MNRIVTCLLAVFLIISTAQGATYRPVQLFAAPVTAGFDRPKGVPRTVGFRNRSASLRLFSAFKKYLVPDEQRKKYRAARWELSIAAFIFGLTGLFIPLLGIIFSIAAIVFGIIAISRRAEYRGLAIIGLILGVLGPVVLVAALMNGGLF